jgi:hypothetical protein
VCEHGASLAPVSREMPELSGLSEVDVAAS